MKNGKGRKSKSIKVYVDHFMIAICKSKMKTITFRDPDVEGGIFSKDIEVPIKSGAQGLRVHIKLITTNKVRIGTWYSDGVLKYQVVEKGQLECYGIFHDLIVSKPDVLRLMRPQPPLDKSVLIP